MFICINKYFQIFIIRNWLMTDAEPPVMCSLQSTNRRVGGIILVQFQRPENKESKWSKFQSKSGFKSREDQCPSSKTVRQKEIPFYSQAVSQPFCSSQALVVRMRPTHTGGFPGSSAGKESTCNAGDLGSIPEFGRSPGEGKGYPLQYSGLESSMDCIVHGVSKSQTRLSKFHFHPL